MLFYYAAHCIQQQPLFPYDRFYLSPAVLSHSTELRYADSVGRVKEKPLLLGVFAIRDYPVDRNDPRKPHYICNFSGILFSGSELARCPFEVGTKVGPFRELRLSAAVAAAAGYEQEDFYLIGIPTAPGPLINCPDSELPFDSQSPADLRAADKYNCKICFDPKLVELPRIINGKLQPGRFKRGCFFVATAGKSIVKGQQLLATYGQQYWVGAHRYCALCNLIDVEEKVVESCSICEQYYFHVSCTSRLGIERCPSCSSPLLPRSALQPPSDFLAVASGSLLTNITARLRFITPAFCSFLFKLEPCKQTDCLLLCSAILRHPCLLAQSPLQALSTNAFRCFETAVVDNVTVLLAQAQSSHQAQQPELMLLSLSLQFASAANNDSKIKKSLLRIDSSSILALCNARLQKLACLRTAADVSALTCLAYDFYLLYQFCAQPSSATVCTPFNEYYWRHTLECCVQRLRDLCISVASAAGVSLLEQLLCAFAHIIFYQLQYFHLPCSAAEDIVGWSEFVALLISEQVQQLIRPETQSPAASRNGKALSFDLLCELAACLSLTLPSSHELLRPLLDCILLKLPLPTLPGKVITPTMGFNWTHCTQVLFILYLQLCDNTAAAAPLKKQRCEQILRESRAVNTLNVSVIESSQADELEQQMEVISGHEEQDSDFPSCQSNGCIQCHKQWHSSNPCESINVIDAVTLCGNVNHAMHFHCWHRHFRHCRKGKSQNCPSPGCTNKHARPLRCIGP
jgi:hypothetical protein